MNSLYGNLKKTGFSLVEMMVSLGLISILGAAAFSLKDLGNTEVDKQAVEIERDLDKLSASKIIHRDISISELSYNFLTLVDDNYLPFFAYTNGSDCVGKTCGRKYSLELSSTQTTSKSIYFILKKGKPEELLKLNIDPFSVFNNSKIYSGINWKKNSDPNLSIEKSTGYPHSPWEPKRLMMISTQMSFFDCAYQTHQKVSKCILECNDCSKATKRPIKFLGQVALDTIDLSSIDFTNELEFKKLIGSTYDICRPNGSSECQIKSNMVNSITSSKLLYENMPYIPGGNNSTFLSPVYLVKYYLERDSINADPKKTRLMRSVATFDGKVLKFNSNKVLMTGIETLVFTRNNISSPLIEYKIKKYKPKSK